MAKLNAPLLSLGARGQLGKAVVYFPWKGLNCARKHVVPANPQTSAQNAQRAHVTNSVATIHARMQAAANPIDEDDMSALALWGSTYATPRTWFNQLVKHCVDLYVAGKAISPLSNGGVTPGAGQLAVQLYDLGADITAGTIYYGTTKNCAGFSQAAVVVAGSITATIVGLTAGVKYYLYFIASAPVARVGNRSGVYYGTPT